jgi:hypothetical protein
MTSELKRNLVFSVVGLLLSLLMLMFAPGPW